MGTNNPSQLAEIPVEEKQVTPVAQPAQAQPVGDQAQKLSPEEMNAVFGNEVEKVDDPAEVILAKRRTWG